MSKLYAVSYMDFHNNDMTIELHRADNWHTALALHTKVCTDEAYMEYLAGFADMADAQEEAFNGDWLFDVKEVPSV